jgi:hypothetical protein
MNAEPDDPVLALLAAWEARARTAQQRGRSERAGDIQSAYFFRGVAETYQRAIAELRALLATGEHMPQQAAPQIAFRHLTPPELDALLERSSLFPRDIRRHDDGAITLVFSRLQTASAQGRLAALQAVEPALILLDSGWLPDTGDPYLDIAIPLAAGA